MHVVLLKAAPLAFVSKTAMMAATTTKTDTHV